MARGFDRSRVDVGAAESRVTGEQTPVYDRDGSLIRGLGSPDALEDLLDVGLLSIDPPVTRIGTIIQAIQSEMWTALELAASDAERQWYLRRSQDLRRFADWLKVSARDLDREELRRRLLDLMVAYGDAGSTRATRRVVGTYTGLPAFVTKTSEYPGYWTVGKSYVTPSHLFVPSRPVDGIRIHEASNSHPVGGLGVLEVDISSPPDVRLRWKPAGGSFGPVVTIVGTGRYQLHAAEDGVWILAHVDPQAIRNASLGALSDLYTVAVIAAPDTCQPHENWLPGARNLASGVWVESFGHADVTPDAESELGDRLGDVSDLAPLNRRRYRLEEPTFWRVPVEIAWFWEQHYDGVAVAFEPEIQIPAGPGSTMPDASAGISPSGADASGFSGVTTAVPICRGPFRTIKERFGGFEHAQTENFDLGPTFHWEARDEVVSQPVNVSGIQIVEVAFGMPSGRGYLSYDPATESLAWQAPDPDGPDELDPDGSSHTLTGAAVSVDQPTDITGVQVQNTSPSTPTGGGVLRFNAVGQSLSWQAPGDAEGLPVAIPGAGVMVLDLRSATTSWSIQVRVTTASLPAFSIEETLGVRGEASLPGVELVGASARTVPGVGRLRSTPAGGGTVTLSWEGPGNTRGPEVLADEDGRLALPSADGISVLYVVVTVADLATVPSLANVEVEGVQIGSARELFLSSGNPLRRIRVRILQTQLQGVWVADAIRMRTAQLVTQPADLPMPTGDVEISVLDRSFAESVRRLAWAQTLGENGEVSAWSPIRTQDSVAVPAGERSVRFRFRLEPNPDFVGYPRRDQYDLVSVILRPRLPRPEDCCAEDDALRMATGGLLAACGRTTPLGIVTRGLMGYLTTVLCDSEIPDENPVDPENPDP